MLKNLPYGTKILQNLPNIMKTLGVLQPVHPHAKSVYVGSINTLGNENDIILSNCSFLCLASNIAALKVSKIDIIHACCDISRHEVYQ